MPLKINVKKFSRAKVNYEADTESEQPSQQEPEHEPENIIIENEEPEPQEQEEENDDFLNDLNNENYTEPPSDREMKEQEKATKEMRKEQQKREKEYLKESKLKEKKEVRFTNILESNNDLFSDMPTEIIGKEKRELINKITQYRNLFPKELSKFKVKKNCNVQELKEYLREAETIIELSSVDGFITDSIIQSLKLVEGASKRTKYDVSGLSDMLKANPKFHSLLKQLYCKYNCFAKIPLEMQVIIMITSSAYVCSNKNKNKVHMEAFLNEQMKQ